MTIRDNIRSWVLLQGKSQRSAAKHFGLSRDTVARLLREEGTESQRQYRRTKPKQAPVSKTVLPHIEQWLAENEQLKPWARKQRWTGHRMWVELRKMGIAVGESTVRQLARIQQKRRKPVFVPLDFGPGERAEFDFGHAHVLLGGRRVRLPFLAGRLRFSGAMYAEFFPTERQDAFLLGQRHAFEFWQGVPQSAFYDNTSVAVKEILQGRGRVEQDAFRHFHRAYLFEAIFANPASGWEKGSVENLVGSARRNYMVPIPEAASIEDLNAVLRQQCVADQDRIMRGRNEPIGVLLAVERQHLRPLPQYPVEVGAVREVLASSIARIRFETNQYSVPVSYAYQRLTLKADPFRVRLYSGSDQVADHPRCYGREQIIEDFRHFIPLLLEKSAAVPFASCLRNGGLPPVWESFRQQLVLRRSDGNREFARVLELCVMHSVEAVTEAIEMAAASSGYSVDAVRQLLRWLTERDTITPPLDSARYPDYHHPQRKPDLSAYNRLLGVNA